MKIVNETRWTTAHLRAVAARIAKKELTPEQRKKLTVIFRSRRSLWGSGPGTGSSGAAYRWKIVVRLPVCQGAPLIDSDRIDLCSVIAHEMKHIHDQHDPHARHWYGRSWERSVRRSIPYGRPRTDEGRQAQRDLYGWVLAMPIEQRPANLRKVVDHVAKRSAKAQSDLKRWQAKLKLATTKVRKLRQRVRYYDRKSCAVAATPAPEAQP